MNTNLNNIAVWLIIENIVTLLVMAGLYWLTKSLWVLVLIANFNSIKTK